MALADLFGRIDALPVERRRHPDVRYQDLGLQLTGPLDDLVIVGPHPDDTEVLVTFDQGAHALSDDQVVVGQED